MCSMMQFTCEPVFDVATALSSVGPPGPLFEDCLFLLKLYVSQAAFVGTQTTVGAPSAKMHNAHNFLLESSLLQVCNPADEDQSFQLTEMFAP